MGYLWKGKKTVDPQIYINFPLLAVALKQGYYLKLM